MQSLHDYRLQTATSLGGISADYIYRLGLSLCAQEKVCGDLFEYGPGQGHFLRLLLAAGYQGSITGADLIPRPADLPESVRWIKADLNEPLPLPDESYDTIVCMEVIAHIENPRFLFREFARLLRPNGLLLLSTPNVESLRSYLALLTRGHFSSFRGGGYPAFITALLREDFIHICTEAGFTRPAFHYTDVGLTPMVHLSWQRLSLGLLKGRLFSDNFALVARKK